MKDAAVAIRRRHARNSYAPSPLWSNCLRVSINNSISRTTRIPRGAVSTRRRADKLSQPRFDFDW